MCVCERCRYCHYRTLILGEAQVLIQTNICGETLVSDGAKSTKQATPTTRVIDPWVQLVHLIERDVELVGDL